MSEQLQKTNGAIAAPAKKDKSLADVTLERINDLQMQGAIDIPGNYSPGNALKSAWLILQEVQTKDKRPALEVCSKTSIANALLKMVVLGLNPSKKQCYFIPYGNALSCDVSYWGDMATAKRVHGDIPDDGFSYSVIYEGDDFQFERKRGKARVIKHIQTLANIDKTKIIGAYCEVYDGDDKLVNSALMNIDEIKQSWRQSKMNPITEKGEISQGGTHGKFTADMALRTVIRKACKEIINSSDDRNLSTLKKIMPSTSEIQAAEEIEENANREPIDFVEAEVVDSVTGELVPAEEPEPAQEAEPY
jgi:recombination protein RecT